MDKLTQIDQIYIVKALELLHAKELKGYEKMKHKLWAQGQIKRTKVEHLQLLIELVKGELR